MAGKFDERRYEPAKQQAPAPVDWNTQSDLDYTTPYPCGVCGRTFTSRTVLATHPHGGRA